MSEHSRSGGLPRAALVTVAGGSLSAWALAAAGQPLLGAVVLAAGLGMGFKSLHERCGVFRALTVTELMQIVEGRPGHPQEPVVREIRGLLGGVEAHGRAIREVVRRLQEYATLVAWLIDTQNGAVGEARESLQRMQEAMGHVGEHAGDVLVASQEGRKSVESTGTSTEALFQSAETLNVSVEEATASILQIHGALSGVQQGVALLSDSSDRATEFIAQVGRAMGGIRQRIEQSLDLSQRVEEHARKGREVVGQVGQGIEKIRGASRDMIDSVQTLSSQSREIEGILGIITDVAEETSLLSLNAAILAAQAGEKGAAFGVVADQIRSLAQRTRESTKHIEELVRGIQANITEANLGLAASLETVEEGGELGHEAVRQLELIDRAVEESVTHASQIAEAAQEQDEKSTAMVNAAGEVNESLHQVAENLGQSIQEMDRIQALIQSLAALSQSVRAAADEHREVSRHTVSLMGSFSARVEGIHGLIGQQEETGAQLATALGKVSEMSDNSGESLEVIHTIVKEMVARTDELQAEVECLANPEDRATAHA